MKSFTREEMAKRILAFEARRDAQGHIKLYNLPSNDGGGTATENREYAGLNDRYDPKTLSQIIPLVESGEHAKAEAIAMEAIAQYTDVVSGWSSIPAIEFFLRDCCFNRGAGGAAKIVQMAAKASPVDGKVGPVTRAAIKAAEAHPVLLLARLRAARERYEDIVAPGRANLRAGLENRWDNSFVAAVQYIPEGLV